MVGPTSRGETIFKYASELTKDEVYALEHAVLLFQTLEVNPAVLNNKKELVETNSLFATKNISNQSLLNWLEKRIQFIISARTTPQMKVYQKNKIFSDPDMPDLISENTKNAAKTSLIMQHVSSQYYLFGKLNQKTLDLSFNVSDIFGDKKVTLIINSPRVGIIKIADNYIYRTSYTGMKDLSIVDDLIRLFYLFHEARHSDGHGRTLALGHVTCPFTHKYAGFAVCDEGNNGAYAISAQFLKLFINNCYDCSDSEKLYLKLLYDDAYERILKPHVKLDVKAETSNKIIIDEN